MNRPPVVSTQEWQAAREALLTKEKQLTRELDALAAERRRLPMVALDSGYEFTAPDGTQVRLTHNLADQSHLNARDTTLILLSPAPQDEIDVVRKRFGWTVPWYSAHGNDFYADLGLGGGFGLSVLLRDGDEVFRTYFTTARGVDRLRLDFNLLDLTPYGRQEEWEDSPAGWPQDPTMAWLRPRDQY